MLFDCLSCLYNQQNHKTTKPQDNQPRFVWKTIPSVARVTRDEVSGFIKHKGTAVWKTVPPHERSIRVNPLIRVRLLPQWFFEHGLSGLTRISLNHVLYVIDFEHGERARMHKPPLYPPVRGGATSQQLNNKPTKSRYCLPDSHHYLLYQSRDFVPGYSRYARYWLPAKATYNRQPITDNQ